jgi:hypothetical protein
MREMIMHEQSITQWVLIILGVLGSLKMLTALGLPELREILAAVFDFISWVKRSVNRSL